MKDKHSSNFLIGILFGVLVGVVIWYWQKSTAADDGALDLLDRMAQLDRKLRTGETAVSTSSRQAASPQPAIPMPQQDNLQRVRGIGPKFDGRLQQAGIKSIAQLSALSAEKLAELLDIGENRAAAILADSRLT
jgi:predicted flap endonuclease-1-like 5' DNA nuclease